MSKNEPNTITTPGAAASRSRSTQKVLDIQRRFIDASKVGNRSWIGSVQGAVATWSNLGVTNSWSLPLPVLTRSKCELGLLRKAEMNLESMIALAASALLLIYLMYALLRPEKF